MAALRAMILKYTTEIIAVKRTRIELLISRGDKE